MKAGNEKTTMKYAKALFESLSADRFSAVQGELEGFSAFFSSADPVASEAHAVFANPAIALRSKKELIDAITGSSSAEIKNLLAYLAERGNLGMLQGVSDHFARLVDAFRKLSQLHVISAEPMSDVEQRKFIEDVKEKLGHQGALVEFTFEADARLLGGVQIRLGDRILDGSLRGAVSRIFNELEKTI